ncbi:MAG: DNA mismatch endonuclease Vsr [Spartobacteria bacterium]|nr:DNA mismatch endonuclease Vsr [Spartobacteria bacterium]
MADTISKERRSEIMSNIRSKNTKPELIVRKLLHNAGYRYRLHRKDLPGKPDIVLPKYNAVIEIRGCFWHGHFCKQSKNLPKSRVDYWQEKIEKNKQRDITNSQFLKTMGWRVCVVWECALTRGAKLESHDLLSKITRWLEGDSEKIEISGYAKE